MNVAEIQRALLARGYDPGPIDGDLGPKTRKAVEAFQREHGLKADGIAGPVTLGALASLTPEMTVKSPSAPKKGRPIHTLVWHCTATPEGREFTRADIDKMHRARGFTGIGYHKLVHLDGSISDGRPESQVGAHVSGHNTGTIGYSYVGGLDAKGKPKDTRTPEQMQTMIRLTREAAAKYALRAVVGHRDLSPDLDADGMIEPHEWVKVCPCFNAIAEYGALLKEVA
ncbi:N-acetyl-anhydromuramyl-L-alanine amidase AmpD [Microvirga lupini]|uniref:N-acetyl-anhydromuramyl-L-alanine amidase AmpD n=1 Tax=Microvirga lupini TaxID=420324 RepID=A0A7W4VPR8_9HYPH|nr:peptidoglycan-binding protein [Microvirga lupini]MBB3020627.1 N-acetyl-anhydromuramyl-L-alanine amidase AmpD [Microvirga lupini]